MSQFPSFDELADHFLSLGTINSPAEIHGLLCGRLCGGARYTSDAWEAIALEFLDPVQPTTPELYAQLQILYEQTLTLLQDPELGFHLLLPDDDIELGQRLTALGQWCHGFLTGFGSSGISGEYPLSAEAAEILRDFAAIAQIEDGEEESEEGETDFNRVVEHVLIGSISLFLEMNKSDEEPLH